MAKSGTPAQVKAKFATWGDYNWYGKCAAVVMTVCRHFGDIGAGVPYPSARAALQAAKIESNDPTKAPAGAIHYWDYFGSDSQGRQGNWGHVGVDMLGRGTHVLNATSYPNEAYGRNVGTSSVGQINGRVGAYRGWSRKYGKSHYASIVAPTVPNPTPAGSVKPSKPAAPGASQRRVSKKINRRIGSPSTKAKTGTPLQPGTIGNFVGFIRGENVGGNNIWLKGTSGDYFHSANFEGTHKGLPDLGTWKAAAKPKPAAKPKTLHLPSFYWYDHPADAEKHQDVHGKRRGESMLSGRYTVLETSRGGAFKVKSASNGVVWVSPLAKKYLR